MLKNDLKKTKELLQSEKEKMHTAKDMIEECRDKQKQAEQERDYALSHAISLVIRTTGVYCNQMVCDGLAGSKRILK